MRARSALDIMQRADPAMDYDRVRQRSMLLVSFVSDEDCGAQSMLDASPLKWHLAHTSWFFETFMLAAFEPGFQPFHPAFRMLFNSYYNGIGARHPRAQRGLLTRPGMAEVRAYRQDVDTRMLSLLDANLIDMSDVADSARAQWMALLKLGLQHEQQHQELMLTDVKHLLAQNPLLPAYLAAPLPLPLVLVAPAPSWICFDGGLTHIGFNPDVDGGGFCFDNELPRHLEYVAPFALAARLVTNREFLDFIEAGGYRNPDLWLAEGWDWVRREQIACPLYWHGAGAEPWHEFTLHGLQRLDMARPACHLSLFEADAYARWVDARLPTEAEWECAQRVTGVTGALGVVAEQLHPAFATDDGLAQMFGCCWQWTSSSYAPYPGYRAARGALGEYNGKFMLNQYVLRGSSCATPPGHARASYRNFFPAGARWQFTGIRLAR